MDELLKKYQALSQACRLRALYLLVKLNKPLYACEIMEALQKKQYQISRCLTELSKAGLIEEAKEGRFTLYSLRQDEPLNKELLKSVRAINAKNYPVFSADLKRMEKRLSMRENGKPSFADCKKC